MPFSINKLLNWAHLQLKYRSSSPAMDAEVVLCRVLNKDKSYLYTNPQKKLTRKQHFKFRSLIAKRARGVPVAYLRGYKEFYGLKFFVDCNTLIPRPETEGLVELAFERINPSTMLRTSNHPLSFLSFAKRGAKNRPHSSLPLDKEETKKHLPSFLPLFKGETKNYSLSSLPFNKRGPKNYPNFSLPLAKGKTKRELNIVDVGCGSGNIIISLAKTLPRKKIRFFAVDNSKKALSIAKKNARFHGVDNKIKYLCGNLLDPFFKAGDDKLKADLIIANLPYLTPRQYSSNSGLWAEPARALVGGKSGLNYYQKLFRSIKRKGPCLILIEIDPHQKHKLQKLARQSFKAVRLKFFKDLAGCWRYAEIRIPLSC